MKINKKILLLTVLLVLYSVAFSGCGKEENESETKSDIGNDLVEILTNEEDITSNTYELSADWDKLKNKGSGIQFDDTLFYVGMTLEQVKTALETSEENYEYEFDENEVIEAGDATYFTVKKDNVEWFNIFFKNIWQEPKTLAEIPVKDVHQCTDTDMNCVMHFGYSKEDILSLNPEEIETFIVNLYPEDVPIKIVQSRAHYNGEWCKDYSVQITDSLAKGLIAEESLWTGGKIFVRNEIEIFVSEESNKVVGYKCTVHTTHTIPQ